MEPQTLSPAQQRFVRYVNLLNKMLTNPDGGQLILMADRFKMATYWVYYMRQIAIDLGFKDLDQLLSEVEMLATIKPVIAAEVVEICQKYFSPRFGIEKERVTEFMEELTQLILVKV